MKDFTAANYNVEPLFDSCICRADYYRIKRQCAKPTSTPPASCTGPPKSCSHPQCSETDNLIQPGFTDNHRLKHLLDVDLPSYVLCRRHYRSAYEEVKYPACACCGAKSRKSAFNRHSPCTSIFNSYLENHTLELNSVSSDDLICLCCYKLHISLLDQDMTAQSKLVSLADGLGVSETSKLEMALVVTCSEVAKEFLAHKALLLPDVSRIFLFAYFDNKPHSNRIGRQLNQLHQQMATSTTSQKIWFNPSI